MKKVRTRFAPSPTGYMHIGNLRTALFAYLYAKANGGDFILRIEDTDQGRYVDGAIQVIYNTMKVAGLQHDEGPDIGGLYGPYIQSERKNMYKDFAVELVNKGYAYYCFCEKREQDGYNEGNSGYDRHCRSLSKEEIDENLASGKPFVIRQKIPLSGQTSWDDLVYGTISVENNTLDDQILLKSDGMPTYNFANVVDDYLMDITHIIRGSEYLSSNPKYILLYQAFGWDIPKYIHLPLIAGKNPDGTVSKLSKRHGAVSFGDLVADGYLPQAIINYIALLGWASKDNKEIYSMDEISRVFNVDGIHKNPAIFDYQKLDWVNSEHIKQLSLEDFKKMAFEHSGVKGTIYESKWSDIAVLLQSRVHKLSECGSMIEFILNSSIQYDKDLFINKKNKLDIETSKQILLAARDLYESVDEVNWTSMELSNIASKYAVEHQYKLGQFMWPLRIAISGQLSTPGNAAEIMSILGKNESISRFNHALDFLQ